MRCFFLPLLVVADHAVRGAQDARRRTVVLLEPDDLGLRVVVLEVQDVADVRAAELVDRLVRIADDADVLVTADEATHQVVLHPVGVLELVDQQPLELLLVALGDVRELGQQLEELADQVVEVERAVAQQRVLVRAEARLDALVERAVSDDEVARRHADVLQLRDPTPDLRRLHAELVEFLLDEDLADQLITVVGVVDREVAGIAELVPVVAEEPRTGRVERRDAHPTTT